MSKVHIKIDDFIRGHYNSKFQFNGLNSDVNSNIYDQNDDKIVL